MSPVGVRSRSGQAARPLGRRRSGGGGRLGGEASPRLFPDGEERSRGAQAPAVSEPQARTRAAGSAGGRGDGMTLQELIRGVWDEVLTEARAACPLCGGEMVGRASAHARPTEGRCRECGTTIA